MFHREKTCCTCLNKSSGELVNISETDSDMISYIDKLKFCTKTDLKVFELNEICETCINQLRITYGFLEMVKAAQEAVRSYMENLQIKTNDEYTVNDADIYESSTIGYTCELCENIFENSSDLYKHCANTHNLESSGYNQVDVHLDPSVNKNCPKATKLYDEIKSNKEESSTNSSTCKQCGELNNKNHLCILRDTEGFRCEYCGLEFEKKWMMQRHRQRVHAERKFACNYCDKAFKQSYHLSEHIRLHTGEMNYECNLCGKKFSRLYCHRRHMRSHQAAPGEKTTRTPFLCSICGKSFPFSNCMERHMRVHQGIRKFECSICNRKFGQSTHLKVHMRMHTGEKPYVCHYCGDSFSLNAKLQKHLAVSHENGNKNKEVKSFVELRNAVT